MLQDDVIPGVSPASNSAVSSSVSTMGLPIRSTGMGLGLNLSGHAGSAHISGQYGSDSLSHRCRANHPCCAVSICAVPDAKGLQASSKHEDHQHAGQSVQLVWQRACIAWGRMRRLGRDNGSGCVQDNCTTICIWHVGCLQIRKQALRSLQHCSSSI